MRWTLTASSSSALRAKARDRQAAPPLVSTLGAGSALLLASIGIYGLMAYSVQQRRTEIGVRMAVGASRADVWRGVLAQGLKLTVLGIAVGVAGAFYLAELLSSFVFGVETRDPVVFVAAPLVLTAVALMAVALPALRASRVDPLNALRHEC